MHSLCQASRAARKLLCAFEIKRSMSFRRSLEAPICSGAECPAVANCPASFDGRTSAELRKNKDAIGSQTRACLLVGERSRRRGVRLSRRPARSLALRAKGSPRGRIARLDARNSRNRRLATKRLSGLDERDPHVVATAAGG